MSKDLKNDPNSKTKREPADQENEESSINSNSIISEPFQQSTLHSETINEQIRPRLCAEFFLNQQRQEQLTHSEIISMRSPSVSPSTPQYSQFLNHSNRPSAMFFFPANDQPQSSQVFSQRNNTISPSLMNLSRSSMVVSPAQSFLRNTPPTPTDYSPRLFPTESTSNDSDNEVGDKRKLFVGQLPPKTKLHELIEEFKQFGPINEKLCVVKEDNYAFIHFIDERSAKAALDKNGALFKGKYIKVQRATSLGHMKKTKGSQQNRNSNQNRQNCNNPFHNRQNNDNNNPSAFNELPRQQPPVYYKPPANNINCSTLQNQENQILYQERIRRAIKSANRMNQLRPVHPQFQPPSQPFFNQNQNMQQRAPGARFLRPSNSNLINNNQQFVGRLYEPGHIRFQAAVRNICQHYSTQNIQQQQQQQHQQRHSNGLSIYVLPHNLTASADQIPRSPNQNPPTRTQENRQIPKSKTFNTFKKF